MENSNDIALNARLETYKAEILNVRKPHYKTFDKIEDKPGKQKFLLKRNVLIDWEMLDSKAFKSLSAAGIRALIRFLQKRTWKGKGRNKVFCNAGIVFTYAEAEELGIGRSSFHGIIKKLYAVGFIEIEHQGGGLQKDCSRYSLSERWKYYGTPHFKAVTKKKVCRPGQDVHSRKQLKQVTRNRNSQLREFVTVGGFESQHGIGNP